MLSGSVLEIAPLAGDDFQSLLPLLPGIIRGPDGRLRAKGGQPTQGGLQISSTSLVDPSTGDFDLELPGQSVESVELLANPFSAEYGRFSTSVTQLRTRRGTNEWEVKPGNLVPRFGKGFSSVRGFEPRFSVRGPLKRDRIFLAQDIQFRYVNDPVKSLPGEPDLQVTSFDSFTRIDGVVSPRHRLAGLIVAFPRKLEHATMNTFRPPETTPEFNQSGTSIGVQDRFALSSRMVLQSTFAGRWFEVNVNTDGRDPMIYAPATQAGQLLQRPGTRSHQSAMDRDAVDVRRQARPAPLEVRSRLPELELRRHEFEPSRRNPSGRRVAGRGHRARHTVDPARQRRRAGAVRSGPLADWGTGHARVRCADGPRRRHRARELVAARRHFDRRAA